MSGIIEGYNYDIFISYRQKDNKGERWVSEFVEAFKTELESTFKEEISVYFDVNPHDGLLETHDVDASLKQKLNCLIFIPIISRTYCDPKSFAWEHEFKAFVEQASRDKIGLKVTLPNGNVASRVLPVRIHDLDEDDIKLCESVLGGFLRGVEFIYKEPGVNRSLRTTEDNPGNNLNKTFYRNQVNKVANAVKEIITGLRKGEDFSGKNKPDSTLPWEEVKKEKRVIPEEKSGGLSRNKLLSYVISTVIVLVFLGVFAIPKIFNRDPLERLRSSGEKISISVMPFQNMTNDTIWNVWQDAIQDRLISRLVNTGDLRVPFKATMDNYVKIKGLTEYSSISPSIASSIARKFETDFFLNGNIKQAGLRTYLSAQMIDTKSNEVVRSFETEGPSSEDYIIGIIDSLSQKLVDFLAISRLIKENQSYIPANFNTGSPEALKNYIYGVKAHSKADLPTAIKYYLKSLAADSDFLSPRFELIPAYRGAGMINKSRSLVIDLKKKSDQMSHIDQLIINYRYAEYFEHPAERINYLKQLIEYDNQGGYHYQLARAYTTINEPDKAIAELEKAHEIFRRWGDEFLKEDLVLPALGEAYHRTGQYKKESKIYSEAERVNDDHSSIYFSYIIRGQASLALTEGDTVQADQYIKELISVLREKSFSEADIATQLGLMYRQAGNLDKTEEYGRKALLLEPENPSRMNNLALFLIDTERNIREGLELTDKALVLRPDNYNFLYTKGRGLFKQGKYNEALILLEKARDLYNPAYSYEIVNLTEEVKKAIAGKE
jgi:tetratricopeptide (TPR) repeat protein